MKIKSYTRLKQQLERVYETYHSPAFLDTDPILFLYRYQNSMDREIAGLIASSLAYGRVAQILLSVDRVLKPMGASPRDFLERSSDKTIDKMLSGFRHRFTTGPELAGMLVGLKKILREFGSLKACFTACYHEKDETTLPALSAFVKKFPMPPSYLLPDPARGSACKRLNLYIRWMVRKDAIDPGGWTDIPAAKLIIPLDTHIHRISLDTGFTERKSADMKTALEITAAFRRIYPEDPLRYDFSLTRTGIIPGKLWRHI